MKTKKKLEKDGWTFITLQTGTISASKLIQEINGIPSDPEPSDPEPDPDPDPDPPEDPTLLRHKARTMKTLRKRITNLYYR